MAKSIKPATPKNSPGKLSGSQEVDEFIKTTDHPLKQVIVLLRKHILDANNKLTENIKWKAPSFCYEGEDRITFNLSKKDFIILVFHTGAKIKVRKSKGNLIEDETGLLEWPSPDRAILKIHSADELKSRKADITRIVNEWITAANI